MRHALIVAIIVWSSDASAAPPSGYQCAPGTVSMGVGCTCPSGFAGARDQENNAICKAVPVAQPIAKHAPTSKLEVSPTLKFKPAPANTAVWKPEVDADSVLSVEGLSGAIRGEQEQILAELIANTPDAEVEEKSDYLFRLGELYAKQQRYFRLKGDATKAQDYLTKAAKTYRQLIENQAFRNYPRMDMAMFYFAYTLTNAKLMAEARLVYTRLIKEYPNSKYVPESYALVGDTLFDSNQLADSELSYNAVLKFPKSNAAPYASYKLGYVQLLQQKPDALESFARVVEATKGNMKMELLNRGARKAVLQALVQLGKAEQTYGYFKKTDSANALDNTANLALLYSERGRHDRAAAVYRELMRELPGSPSFCEWQSAFSKETLLAAPTADQTIDVCTGDLDTFRQWARNNGVVPR